MKRMGSWERRLTDYPLLPYCAVPCGLAAVLVVPTGISRVKNDSGFSTHVEIR